MPAANFIRNFCIIAHINHGKSTLADRFLELTNTVPKDKMMPQYLDAMELEKEKGITIKLHPVRMKLEILNPKSQIPNKSKIQNPKFQTSSLGFRNSDLGFANSGYILNLIDTPGHIDFSYETSRALACVEGAILLVDATKGIQAQTLFNLEQAQKQQLKIIGAVNKIDLPQAQVEGTKKELAAILNVPEKEIFAISAKNGTNVPNLLQAVVDRVPPPKALEDKPFKALIFDSKYDPFFGVIAYLRVFEGEFEKGDNIYLVAQAVQGEVKEIGYFSPDFTATQGLKAGEIGYIKTGIKDSASVKVGDTIIKKSKIKNQKSKIGDKTISGIGYPETQLVKPLPGYKEPQPVLFLSLYPEDADDFENLKASLEKLKLNDPALNFQLESKTALGPVRGFASNGMGRGLRVGFLGSLHAEITIRRLKAEFGLNLVATSPQVIFKVLTKQGETIIVSSPIAWPDPAEIKEIKEPWARLEVLVPPQYFNQLFKLLKNFKALFKETKSLTSQKSIVIAEAPLRGIIAGNFYDKLKSSTEGYGSFSFQPLGFREADLVKIDIFIAGEWQESLARIVPKEKAFLEGKKLLRKLKETLPQQQFNVALQACLNFSSKNSSRQAVAKGKVIARETIKAKRKDVTAPLYGGDVTRKRKLLEIQKKGKEKLKTKGKVRIPPEVFLELLRE